jgi:opacity protein-like surface antigen
MSSAKKFAVASSLVIAAQSWAFAADYPPVPPPQPPQQYYQPPPQPYYPPPPPPPPVYQPPPQVYIPPPPPPPPPPIYVQPQPVYQQASISFSGWYLRGDVGISAQKFLDFKHTQTNSGFTWPSDWKIEHTDIKDAMYFGLGVGYQLTAWFRLDFTGEYRQSTKGKVTGSYGQNCAGGGTCFDLYDFDHQASVFLINAYLDMGTWWCFTPFVGFGIGGAYHTFHALTDIGLNSNGTTGFGLMDTTSNDWSFAYALHAGVAFEVSKSFKIELAYRYLSLGSPDTGIINCGAFGCSGTGPRAFYTLNDFTANELRLGVRWMFDCCDVPPPPPPPVYQPPLMRRG